MNASDITQDVVDAVVVNTATVSDIEKAFTKVARTNLRRGYGSGLTHGLLLGLAAGAVGLVALRHIDVQVTTVGADEDN